EALLQIAGLARVQGRDLRLRERLYAVVPELDVTVGRGKVDVDDEVVPDPAHQRSGPERRVSVVVDLERRALDVEFERRRAAATGVMPLGEDLPGVRRRKIGGEHGAPRVPPVVAFDVVVTLHRNFVARSAEG